MIDGGDPRAATPAPVFGFQQRATKMESAASELRTVYDQMMELQTDITHRKCERDRAKSQPLRCPPCGAVQHPYSAPIHPVVDTGRVLASMRVGCGEGGCKRRAQSLFLGSPCSGGSVVSFPPCARAADPCRLRSLVCAAVALDIFFVTFASCASLGEWFSVEDGGGFASCPRLGRGGKTDHGCAGRMACGARAHACGLGPGHGADCGVPLQIPRMGDRSPPRDERPRSRSPRRRSRSPPRDGGGGGGGGKVTGIAARWNDRGFGFIKPNDGSDDVFCHFSSITDGNQLREGSEVSFEKVFDDRKGKYRAENVTGGIQGSLPAPLRNLLPCRYSVTVTVNPTSRCESAGHGFFCRDFAGMGQSTV